MLTFYLSLLFLTTIGLMQIAAELNSTSSSYGVRRGITQKEFDNGMFFRWYTAMESKLKELYDQEFCESMTLTFEEFCEAMYYEKKIVYIK